MKNAFFILLLGLFLGALSYHVYLKRDTQRAAKTSPEASVVERTQSVAADTKQAITSQLADWNLTSTDIKADFAKAGKVVRTKTKAARETMSDARIVAVIKGKYAFNSDLSALPSTLMRPPVASRCKATRPPPSSLAKPSVSR